MAFEVNRRRPADEINEGLPELMGKTAIDVSRANPDRLFAMVEADPGGGLFRSDDAGASWELVSDDWTIRAGKKVVDIEVFADPIDQETVHVLNAPMMKSTWRANLLERSVLHGDTHDLWINPDDNKVMINANDEAHVSFNAGDHVHTE